MVDESRLHAALETLPMKIAKNIAEMEASK